MTTTTRFLRSSLIPALATMQASAFRPSIDLTRKASVRLFSENANEDEKPMTGFDTISLHAGYEPDTSVKYGLGYGAPRGVPIYRTTPFVFRDTHHAADLFALKELGNIYSRLMNPTTHVLEVRYAMMEGAHPLSALATASGTNSIFYAIANLASVGDNIVSASALYGGTYTMFKEILPSLGIEVRFVNGSDPENFVKASDDKTRAFFCESVSNPSLEVFDIEEIANKAHDIGLPLIVDSTFSTPALTRPLDWGADIVVSSLTKWVGGHGAGLGGIMVDSGKFNWGAGKHPLYDIPDKSYGGDEGLRWGHDLPDELQPLAYKLRALTVPLRNLGGCISPDNSWIILQGMETLSLRMERHCENAKAVAEHLLKHPKVAWVKYPGLPSDPNYKLAQKYLKGKGGGMVVFGVKSDDPKAAGESFINNVKLFSHVANVGDARSLAIHPASTTHSQLNDQQLHDAGVPADLVRLSIGIETIDDILTDLDRSLAKCT